MEDTEHALSLSPVFLDRSDRSPGSKPLESRPTLLGHLIRFSKSPSHPNLSTAIGEVFWSACGANGRSRRGRRSVIECELMVFSSGFGR